MKRPTMADIARRAGVSKVAVSYALNDQPGVSEATRASIKSIAEELGWRPNSAARALTGGRAQAVGLVVRRPARTLGVEPFFMEFISGVETVLAEHAYALMLQMVTDQEQEIEVCRRWWGERRVDGVFLMDLQTDDERLGAVREIGLPAVAIGPPDVAGELPAIWSDDGESVYEIVRYLTALGHRRIARVAGPAELAHTAVRDAALAEVCREAGIPAAAVVYTDYTGDEGARAARALLIAPERPTAIVFDNDIMAVAALSVAQELGLSIPADVSIVAWDESPLTQVVRPMLSAVTRDIPAYGAHSATALLALIGGEDVGSVRDGYAHFVPRGSTAPPPPEPAPR
ncbi:MULTISPECIES: LacI family DNA-binding transcriptional regulator [unclassified Streptomyces]|uniref:LacI family DNA-binding transcriptional regulator n=1 Tax=unclassified Streptomyces TaxID=2593676 RepID=UPI0006F5FE05|nr:MULTISPECIES: LacI family DNA-binding transcriptional regulator [unclassified Streptomyces]KQX48060.1 LacI family transcriptional regulator [Streptomyces sp. Root1304]KRA82452.1 LacI family transcriptional regulator [Streptomyces sp. Root66D1]